MDRISAITKILGYYLFIWLNMDKQMFNVLLVLMCIDSVMGSIKAYSLGYKVTLKRLLWGFTLKLCFLIIPLTIALLGKPLEIDLTMPVNIIVATLSLSEAYSILGNIYMAKNRKKIKNIDFVSVMLKSVRKVLEKALLGTIEQIETRANLEKQNRDETL